MMRLLLGGRLLFMVVGYCCLDRLIINIFKGTLMFANALICTGQTGFKSVKLDNVVPSRRGKQNLGPL